MWSIGVTAYFLLCGYTPFDPSYNYSGSGNSSRSYHEEIQAILASEFEFEPEHWSSISADGTLVKLIFSQGFYSKVTESESQKANDSHSSTESLMDKHKIHIYMSNKDLFYFILSIFWRLNGNI